MRPVLSLAWLELKRFLADRFNLFFVFVLPLILVVVLGLQAQGQGEARIALTGSGPTTTALAERLEGADIVANRYDDRSAVDREVGSGGAELGVVVPDQPADSGALEIELLAVDGAPHPVLEPIVQTAAQEVVLANGHAAALAEAGVEPATAEQVVTTGPDGWTRAEVQVEEGDPVIQELSAMGRFDIGAAGQLLVFVFLNTLTAAAATIQSRRTGALRRVMAAPITSGQAITGLALGRFVNALFQGGYIMAASSLLFGVDWGNVWAALAVLAVFGLVAAGLALLLGVLMDGEGPASGIAVGGGLILAALGGCMVPLEFFSDTMRTVAHFTPHAWAYEALAEIQRRDGGILDVLPQLGVLGAMAVVVLAAGALTLRRSLQRAI